MRDWWLLDRSEPLADRIFWAVVVYLVLPTMAVLGLVLVVLAWVAIVQLAMRL